MPAQIKHHKHSTQICRRGQTIRSLLQGVPRGGFLGLPTPRLTIQDARRGLEGPRRGWEELGRKWESNGGREG